MVEHNVSLRKLYICNQLRNRYLRHHWRIDLLGGLAYSAFAYTLFQNFILTKEREFVEGISGQTAWARLFSGTRLETLFDAHELSYQKVSMSDV